MHMRSASTAVVCKGETRMNGTLHTRSERAGRNALLWMNGVLLALLAYFSLVTVYSSDDYWYSTFWDNGWRNYLELMEFHYRSFNGRTLVHVLAHVILHFGGWFFALVCCGLCVTSAWLAAKADGLERGRFRALLFVVLIGIFSMPLDMFNQGMMWVSAFCNYLFPVTLACLLILALERGSRWVFLPAFLCGASTEQMGLAAVALCGVYTVLALVRRRGAWRCAASMLMAIGGVLTIFLSPATRLRAERSVPLDSLAQILELLRKDILLEVELLTANPAPVLVMLAVLCLGALLLWNREGLKWPAILSAAGSVALIAGSFGNEPVCIAGFIVGFAALAGMGWMLLTRGGEAVGAMILTALAAAAVMLPTDTIEPRVMLPVYLLLLLAAGCMLVALLPQMERMVIPAAAALAVMLVIAAPAVRGYWHNYQMDARNKAYAREDVDAPFIRYCVDYDMDYTWSKAFFDGYFRSKYAESIGLPETAPIRFYSEHLPVTPIRSGGTELAWLPVRGEDGTMLFPMREVIETMGGTLDWYGRRMVVKLRGTEFELLVSGENALKVTWTDEDGADREVWGRLYTHYGSNYCDGEIFAEAFELPIQWDAQSGAYLITQ